MTFQSEVAGVMNSWVDEFTAGNVEAYGNLYTENGAIYSPYDLPAVGRNAIRAVQREWMAIGETNNQIEMLEAYCEGSMGYCVAAYSCDIPRDDGSMH